MLWALTVIVLTLIPSKAIPDVRIFQADKLVHFFIFGVQMVLSSYGLSRTFHLTGKPKKPLLVAALFSFLLGIFTEFTQQYVPGRSPSVFDMIANTVGVGLGYYLFIVAKRKDWV